MTLLFCGLPETRGDGVAPPGIQRAAPIPRSGTMLVPEAGAEGKLQTRKHMEFPIQTAKKNPENQLDTDMPRSGSLHVGVELVFRIFFLPFV